MSLSTRFLVLGVASLVGLGLGCANATKTGSPQPKEPSGGTAALSSADVKMHVERVLASDGKSISIAARDGCLASIAQITDQAGSHDEMRVRCPKPGRMGQWFDGVDRMTSAFPMARLENEEDDSKLQLPAVELVTAAGVGMRLTRSGDAAKVLEQIRSLTAELQSSETPAPGPDSPAGWQMLRVSGPAHVMFGGEPLTGVLDARVSTNGQYLCEFNSNTDDGPLHATKSGFIPPQHASRAIDEVLKPLEPIGPGEHAKSTYALGIKGGAERKASATSTAAVFDRFSSFQDVLGDACLPELEAPAAPGP